MLLSKEEHNKTVNFIIVDKDGHIIFQNINKNIE